MCKEDETYSVGPAPAQSAPPTDARSPSPAAPGPPRRAPAQVGGVVRHSQRTARDPEELKNARRLAAMTAMRGLGFEPDARLWASPGFEPRAVPLERVHGEGGAYVNARAAAGGRAKRAPAGAAAERVKRERLCAAAHGAPFSIVVTTISGKQTRIDLAAGAATTVLDLKRVIEEAEGPPADQQRLFFAGRQLEDGRPLSDYGVVHETKLLLVLRLSGC
jgi:ubiquitin-large subunit ribosomal protein L40e